MPFVPGIEISAEYTATGTMHILGYFIDETTESFADALAFLKRARRKRNPQIIKRLNHYGVTRAEFQAALAALEKGEKA